MWDGKSHFHFLGSVREAICKKLIAFLFSFSSRSARDVQGSSNVYLEREKEDMGKLGNRKKGGKSNRRPKRRKRYLGVVTYTRIEIIP